LARRRAAVAAVLVAGLAIGGYFLFRPVSGSGASGLGGPAPLFESTDLNGHPVRLADDRGRPVLLNFWASWCEPCRQEFPVLSRLVADRPDVVLLGVVFQDGDGAARRFMADHAAGWPGVRDPEGQVADAYGVRPKPGIPQTILVDASGRLVGHHAGPFLTEAELLRFLANPSAPIGS
jgi:cytochrome c biogenesis protein CcmG/thiol:disulfide interchange protein DsbE